MKGKVISFPAPERGAVEPGDDALVASCAAGRAAALGTLFDRHHAMVHRVLSRLPGADAGDVEDLVQQTFIEVHRSARRFDGRSAVRTWIVSIAINVVRHHVRSEARRRALENAAVQASAALTPERPDDAERVHLADRLWKGMAKLSQDRWAAFVLCDLEGMSGVEAAEALDVPEGTVWRRLHEARNKLRETLKEE
ncbi:MAG: RNA polymerase sigma factor [Deltaproteobacteria bacterium]|nr:RNA polymerase sigma factor [Deltaproteobacteria bacterium]